jgi:hypothetical protein
VIALIAPADLAARVPDTRAATFPDDIRDEQPVTIWGPRLASDRADVRVLAAGGSTESSAANQSVQGNHAAARPQSGGARRLSIVEPLSGDSRLNGGRSRTAVHAATHT